MARKPLLLIACLLASLPLAANSRAGNMARTVTIYRDNYGVPHIYGPTDASCVFGFAYAQAEDNFWQVEDSYLRALGRASEVYGEKALDDDRLVRALEITRLSKEEYQRSSPRIRELLDAFADGVNYYLERHPTAQPRLLSHFEGWEGLAFGRYALYEQFIYGHTGLNARDVDEATRQGSNMWAVMPAKSAAGHAMLFINPHQPFFGVGQWYEGHVHSAEGWDMSGASFFGSPSPTIGHNAYLGWSHTVNEPDIADVWEETFDKPGDPLAYKYDGGYRRAVEWTDSIRVKTEHGEITVKKFTFRKTHHGPVVAMRNGKALTVRMARFAEGGAFQEWYEMSKAHNLADFKKVLSEGAIPMFNVVYADREGNIFYLYNGAVPRRSTRFDWSKPVDGTTSETEWKGYHSIDELPQVTNPKSGFVQNCNSTPFLTTVGDNPDPHEFPAYMVGEGDTARARISRRILWNKDKFTFDEWAKAGFDTYVIEAETQIPFLAEKWEELKKTDAARAARLDGAIVELREWNHVSTIQSVPMTLFSLWYWQQYRNPELRKDPLGLLENVMSSLEKNWGTWRVRWGDLNRLERRQSGGEEAFSDQAESVPVAGAPGPVGIVFNFYARPQAGQKRYYGVAGHSFVSVVEFAPQVRARSILVFGENSDPNSKHYFDQSRLYARQEFKPAWFRLDEIQAHAERAYHPGE